MAKVARVWDGTQWVVLSPSIVNPYPSQTGNSGKFLQTDGSSVTWQSVDLSAKANLNSPQFTGTPLAPTPAPGTNTTQIATTAFVVSEINSLIDAAPGALNTLNELAAAINDDANFATTITTSLSDKVSKSGGDVITTTSTTTTPLTISSILNQTSNLQIWKKHDNTILAYINNDGTLFAKSGTFDKLTAPVPTDDNDATTKLYVDSLFSTTVSANSPSLTGTPTSTTPPTGNNSNRIATTEFVQKTLEITQLDTFTFDGKTLRFLPTYLGEVVEIDHPLRLLLNINGIIQIVAEKPSTVWLSGMASYGYYIDDEGYIVLPEPPEPGSYFEARLFPGVDLQKRPDTYPFRAIDIFLGD
jgi:hypothetical protein